MKPSTIAIVGMAARLPGAHNVHEFWRNLHAGVESIRTLSDAELLSAGVRPEELARPGYVKRAAVLDDVPMFDAAFFGLSPRDAAIMDPQHRHFLECAWEALEDASHTPQTFKGSIGVFAGSGMNTYLIHNLLGNCELLESAGLFQLKQTGNDKDVLATRVSYQFDLRGPSINVQTACSTSLVAVHLACQSLLNFECDMALAGGVTIEIPHGQGYNYREGEILSRDGFCRPFDAASTGTVFGSGAGVVVLRRLEDAIDDHDSVRAVILGSAINNDGARKVGYFAPSVDGQSEVIAEALEFAGVSADDISYVEAHGTGTVVGDPIEVRALTQAFRKTATRNHYCGIGSLKGNVGHLDAAAGVAALIKTVLALEHAQVPASLHFNNPNPHIEFEDSPFVVNNKLTEWPSTGSPRRAGVTSLGIGGTNAHAVLEEAPRLPMTREARPFQLLTIAAKTEEALERSTDSLIQYLDKHPETSLADAAFTCQVGRHGFAHRRALVVSDDRAEIRTLAGGERGHLPSGLVRSPAPQVVFMFSGQGSQYVNMGRDLYEHENVFRESMDACAEHLLTPLGLDLRESLYPSEADKIAAAKQLNETWLTQPALFALEYSLARWWMSLGVGPSAMVGHSIGEYVAACIAGVFSLEDALTITCLRGRLMYGLPPGAMLAVPLPASAVPLNGSLCFAAINSPGQCVVTGPSSEIAALEQDLAMQSVHCRQLATSHAFHSAMMDPILGAFEEGLRKITLQPPRLPYLSNVTGTWIRPEEATNPEYWANQLRETVRFSECIAELLPKPECVFLEVGPGNVLTSLTRQQSGSAAYALQSLPHPREATGALRSALHALGQLWTLGTEVDWSRLHAPNSVRRIPLPTYPFEHKKYWIEADRVRHAASQTPAPAPMESDLLLYSRTWKRAPSKPAGANGRDCWLIFNDVIGLGERIAAQLDEKKQDVILVDAGPGYSRRNEGIYTVRPGVRSDYDALVKDIVKSGHSPSKIVHLWSVLPENQERPLDETMQLSFFSLLYLAQALASEDLTDVDIALVSNRLQQISDESTHNPARALLLGPARVIPKELPGMNCRSIDVDCEGGDAAQSASQVLGEMATVHEAASVAFRGGERFVETVEQFKLSEVPRNHRLEPHGTYLITGGLGGLGLVVAEHLAREYKARLVLAGRSRLPSEDEWEASENDTQLNDAERAVIAKLIEIRSIVGGLLVAHGDVTNLEEMRNIVSLARKHFGRIDGVFHAAGILDDGPLMTKTTQEAMRVLDAKVRGTLVLEEAVREEPLRCFVLFSSVSSIYPAPGQVDYAAANAFLDAFAQNRGGTVTAIDWGAWREVGMAARGRTSHPLLEERLLNMPNEIVYSSRFSEARQWVLAEHKLNAGLGSAALLPGTGYMEMAAAAFPRGQKHGAIEFRDVFFLAPLQLGPGESREVRVQLRREQEGGAQKNAFQFSVFSKPSEWVEHSTGTIETCLSQPAGQIDRTEIAARCREREVNFDEEHRTRQERQLVFGPRWRSLKRLLIGKQEALAEITLDEKFLEDTSIYRLHPALLDLATGAAFYLTENYDDSNDLFLPFSYKRMCVYHPLPARLFSHIRSRHEQPRRSEMETFDVTLFDANGGVLAEIEGFGARRIANAAQALQEGVGVLRHSQGSEQQPVEIPDPSGIKPIEGARALVNILSVAGPRNVIVVAEPLRELNEIKPALSSQAAQTPTVKTVREDGTIEGVLAGWWRDLLGVDQVGLDDDFFTLGGHSLVGVRLLAKVKKVYKVDLDFTILFEARTVSNLADVIRTSKKHVSGAGH